MKITAKQALENFGYKVSPYDSVFQGSAEEAPVYGFLDAWQVVDKMWVDGKEVIAKFLVCLDPGTGNCVQSFEI